MPEIKIKVRDKCAEGDGVIICNNSDYTVVWDLDGEWTPYDTKTMRVNLADGTYSITEPVHAIDITIDSNGDAFSLKKIFIYSPLGLKADGNSQVFIELYSGASTAMYFSSMNDAIEKSPKALFAEFDVVGSFYREYLLTSTYHLEDVMSQNVGLMLSKNKGPITRISISLQYNCVFTNGEFQIYGVRE